MITSEEIKRRLWNGANELRGSMDASRYKDYMLGLMFYKFLSDKTLDAVRRFGQFKVSGDALLDQYAISYQQVGTVLITTIRNSLGYCIEPQYLYQTWIRDISSGDFEVQKVTESFGNFERSIALTDDADDFKGLFANSTLDLSDTALGSNLNERSKNIKALILLFADLDMVELQDGDVLGDAYEYLIGQFAMESGKKAGEFYTPRKVSEVLAQIVAKSGNITSVYDPTVGSGSLLLTVGRHLSRDEQDNLMYFGQEKNTATFNLTRMNLLLHGVKPQKMEVHNGDTLAEDWPEDPNRPNEGRLFDAVVMNPPYSLKRWNRSEITVSDPRFESFGVLPPDSKGDYAFLLHGLYHLSPTGTMAILLPHGVLFRGGAEGVIRKRLLEKNYLDTVIGLPANLFTNTGIPVLVMVLKKNRPLDAPLLVIDASKNFIKEGKQNALQEKDIARIVDTYTNRFEVEGYSHLANREELEENDYNLNIPRYVQSGEVEIPHDVDAHLYGGIPESNIKELHVLNQVVPDVLAESLQPLRKGYVELTRPIEEIRIEVLAHKQVQEKITELTEETSAYLGRYWDRLRKVTDMSEVAPLKEGMLQEIKELLGTYHFVDVYDGYQIIADTWGNSIEHDLELIAAKDFYSAARQLEPNMVTKGSGNSRRQEQDGWAGSIIPNSLALSMLFSKENEEIRQLERDLDEVSSELDELVEAAKVEDSNEYNALNECLKRNADDEPGDVFESKSIKAELRTAENGSDTHKLLLQAEALTKEKSDSAKNISAAKKALDEKVTKRIPVLTDEEVDTLVYEKWFGQTQKDIVALIQEPLHKDLDLLETLDNRYKTTIKDLDEEIKKAEDEITAMLSEMVIMYD